MDQTLRMSRRLPTQIFQGAIDKVTTVENSVPDAIAILDRLVSFDTTSRNSNLELLSYVEELVVCGGAQCRRVANDDLTKANLLIRFGPETDGGVVLSGHTDVVPVDGQNWNTPPFSLTADGERLYGRGTSDMKSFIACSLAAACSIDPQRPLSRPLYLALSYDEEVGCFGAPSMIEVICRECPAIDAVIVGEPTNMQVVGAHKGIICYRVRVLGHEAHSSLTHLGISANTIAVRLMSRLVAISDRLTDTADVGSPFEPKQATLTIGTMSGGTALNILAKASEFVFDLRCRAEDDPDEILRPFLEDVATLNDAMRKQFPDVGITVERLLDVPSFGGESNQRALELARHLTGDNAAMQVVPYGSEAGQFQGRDLATVICGPGSIEQAHQPNEFIDKSQIVRCMTFMHKLIEQLH
jgi:acetylornithine deacetylase